MKKLIYKIFQIFARRYLRRTMPYLIGVTGSVGKTTARMIIAQMLRHQLPNLRIDTSEKNFNSDIGLCFAILGIQKYTPTIWMTISTLIQAFWIGIFGKKRADIMILEYGIDHPGDMQTLLHIATPHVGILTAIDKVHAAYFSDETEIFTEKKQLLDRASEIAFWSADLTHLIDMSRFSRDVLSFALHADQEADIGFSRYGYWRVDESIGSQAVIHQGDEQIDALKTNLIGEEQMGYIALAYEIAQIIAKRFDTQIADPDIEQLDFDLQPGRSSVLLGKRGSIIIDSSYNASPQSMSAMIDTVMQIRQTVFPERNLVFCLGDMRELGQYSEIVHRELAKKLLPADQIFLIGEQMKSFTLPSLLETGFTPHRVHRYETPGALGDAVDERLETQADLSLILCKGSQNTIFLEEAVKTLLRYPEDVSKLCRQEDRWKTKKHL